MDARLTLLLRVVRSVLVGVFCRGSLIVGRSTDRRLSRARQCVFVRGGLSWAGAVVVVLGLLMPTSAVAQRGSATRVSYGPPLARSTIDRRDDSRKPQIHVMYVLPSDRVDRALDTDGTLKNTVSSFQAWLSAKTGGRALRLDTFRGSLDISFFRLSRTDAQIESYGAFVRDQIELEIKAAGFNAPKKIYAVYYDGTSDTACGGGAWPPTLPGNVAAMYLNGLPASPVPCASNQFAGADGAPTYLEFAMLHEIMHTMGFVPTCAPHQWRAGHVSDNPNDLMWAGDGAWVPDGWASVVLDSGNDDYFKAPIRGCLDLARSRFLSKYEPKVRLDEHPRLATFEVAFSRSNP